MDDTNMNGVNGEEKKERHYDLMTIDGIAKARNELYDLLMNGAVTELRASTAERLLRGQSTMRDINVRLIRLLASNNRGGRFDQHIVDLAKSTMEYLGGGPKSLTSGSKPA